MISEDDLRRLTRLVQDHEEVVARAWVGLRGDPTRGVVRVGGFIKHGRVRLVRDPANANANANVNANPGPIPRTQNPYPPHRGNPNPNPRGRHGVVGEMESVLTGSMVGWRFLGMIRTETQVRHGQERKKEKKERKNKK